MSTGKQFEAARKVIREHYNLSRRVTDAEVSAELASLRRKQGDYDDRDGYLAARLECAGYSL